MSEQRLLTVREVAARLRSSPETVRRWLRQGKLRGFRLGGTKLGYRVTEGELDRFLAEFADQIPLPTQRGEDGGAGSGP